MSEFNMPIIPDSSIPSDVKKSIRIGQMERDIENRHTYHPPSGDQAARYGSIRSLAREFGIRLVRSCPESRELSLALTKLDEVVFFANAAIARNE